MEATSHTPPGSNESDSDASSPLPHHEPITIESILSDLRTPLSVFLLAPTDTQMWEPPKTWHPFRDRDAEDISRARALSMPTIRATSQFPDMLLYCLGQMHILDPDYPARLKRFLSGDHHIYLCNASGTGKTRLLFESLAQKWGIYLTCFHDRTSDPYGSPDLQKALSELAWDDDNNRILSDIVLGGSDPAYLLNRERVATLLRRVILARLLVLGRFMNLVNELQISDAVARRKWLILQLLPTETVGEDVFVQLVHHISDLSDADVEHRLSTASRAKVALVAIDEAQVALNMHQRAFSFLARHRHAPALREVIYWLANEFSAARILVAGTQLGIEVMRDAVSESSAKFRDSRHFHDLGAFRTKDRIHDYIAHFLGPSTASEISLLSYKWLQGRHRFLANLVTYTLLTGVAHVVNVLDTLIYQMTGFVRSDAASRGIMHIGRMFKYAWLENFPFAHLLRQALLSFIRKSAPSTYADHAVDLVSVGAALYGVEQRAQVFEPLVFLALSTWLQKSARFSAAGIMRRCIAGDDPRYIAGDDPGHAVVPNTYVLDAVASCIQRLAVLPDFRLQWHLRLSGPVPQWAQERAKLVLPRMRGRTLEFSSLSTTRPSLPLFARSLKDVHDWFESATQAFLVPGGDDGASMLCFFQLEESGTVFTACFDLPEQLSPSKPCDPMELYDFMQPFRPFQDQDLSARLPALPLPADRSSRHERVSPTSSPSSSILHIICFADVVSAVLPDSLVSSLKLSELALNVLPDEVQYDDVVAAADM